LTAKKFEAKDDSKSSKSSEAPQGAKIATSCCQRMVRSFVKNYLSRISVSHDLVEFELYKMCISLLGDLGVKKPLIWLGMDFRYLHLLRFV
jgi:hypothetical protein